MRSIAVSMIVALAVALLAFCGGGRALATTVGGSAASASGLLPADGQDTGLGSPTNACENALGALGIAAASCDAGLAVLNGLSAAGISPGGGSSASQPNCQCGSMPTPSATPTCQYMSTPPPSTPTCSCTSAADTTGKGNAPPIGGTPPMGDTPQVGIAQRGDSPMVDTLQKGQSPKLRDSANVTDSKGSPILPITGANMEPLAGAASIFLIAGTAALIAGRRGRVARFAGAHGKRRHAHGSRRAA